MQTVTENSGAQAMRPEHRSRISPQVPKFLVPEEARALIDAAGRVGRQPLRDRVLVQLMYRHGLRCREARLARWDDFDLGEGPKVFRVQRVKSGTPSLHHLDPDEVKALRKLKAASDGAAHVFVSEQGKPLSADMVARVVQRAGEAAGLGPHCHPHQLRHAAGYALINSGVDVRSVQAFLGHKSIQTTTLYTNLSAERLAGVRVR